MEDIEQYVIESLRSYGPDKIVVFGSRASGNATGGSDVDLLIVKDDQRRPVERIRAVQALLYHRSRASRWKQMPPFETLVFTPAEIAQRLKMGDPFFRTMIETGRVIFDRDRDAA